MKFGFYALKLTLLCVIVFIIQLLFPGFTDMFILDSRAYYEVWRFVTAIFLHANLSHILFNGFALALFGSILEGMIGGRRFLTVFFMTGILANIVAVNFYSSSLGASGAIYGVIGALVFIRPFMIVWAFGFPMPIIAAGIIWVAGDLMGLFMPSDVANIAHLAGIGFGLLLGFLYRPYYLMTHGRQMRKQTMQIDESRIREWEDHYLR